MRHITISIYNTSSEIGDKRPFNLFWLWDKRTESITPIAEFIIINNDNDDNKIKLQTYTKPSQYVGRCAKPFI